MHANPTVKDIGCLLSQIEISSDYLAEEFAQRQDPSGIHRDFTRREYALERLASSHTMLRCGALVEQEHNLHFFISPYTDLSQTRNSYRISQQRENKPKPIILENAQTMLQAGATDTILLLEGLPILVDTYLSPYNNLRRVFASDKVARRKQPFTSFFEIEIGLIYVVPSDLMRNAERGNEQLPPSAMHQFLQDRHHALVPFYTDRETWKKDREILLSQVWKN